ncbi:g3742 [Coccomyxa viridis]|uniref:G3742 protein n=1 Tax=Coccomyxa viridis TaxID=1274662 RepID=A0ABP1FTN7_9CHLO
MQITPIHDRTPCTPSTSGRVPPLKYRSRRCTTNVSETLTRAHLGSPPHRGQRLDISLNAATEGSEVYQGAFGEWSVEESDVKEVLGYRAGLSVAALALLLDTAIYTLSLEGTGLQFLRNLENPIALMGAAGFGVSLYLIHIYVTPIKRFLQLLWATGVAGGAFLMATQAQPITEYVASHQEAIWAVGPMFAAFTGVAFKEGVCYGKPECAVLFFLTPALLIGHLSGIVPEGPEKALLAAFVATTLLFAGRKYTQAIKDDIGDKSVFVFQAMSEEEQERLLAERRQRQTQDY